MNVDRLKLAIVSCGFLGCAPVAPGTFGTLGGVAIAWLLSGTGRMFPVWCLIACVALYALTAPLGRWAESYAGKKDPGIFVMDEVIGYLITILWFDGPSYLALVTAFFVFRFFDIVKPWPARAMERIGGGHGILLDDVFAGIWALAAVMVPLRLIFSEAPWVVGS
jgi:phosphatidylglycerophosphatase A